jgi:hypothetical protein
MTAASFGEYGVLRAQLVSGLIGRLVRAVARDTEIPGEDAGDALTVVEHVGRGEAGQHVDAERLGLAREPPAEVAQADDEIAAIPQRARNEEFGNAHAAVRAREPLDTLRRHARLDRRTALAPIGEQLVERARLEDRSRNDVRADGRAFLDDPDRKLAACGARELRQPTRRRETGRAGADDDDIELHAFA